VSLTYGFLVGIGLVALLIPGLIAIARWSLVVPLVVIEGRGWREAFTRSSKLVKGQTGRVLVATSIVFLLTAFASLPLPPAQCCPTGCPSRM